MGFINKQDTNGTKGTLLKGELGYDDYTAGGDTGRVYVGNGSTNIPLAKKSEADDKLPLAGGSMTGYFAEKSVAMATNDIAWNTGNHFTKTITTTTTLTFSGLPANGTEQTIILNLANAGSQTVTFPTINWIKPDGTTTTSLATYLTALGIRPALQTSGNDVFVFWVSDGSTVRGKLV